MESVEEEFQKFLEELTNDLGDAKYQFDLYISLQESLSEYEREINQSVAFWGRIFNALKEASILSLCRAYDSHDQTINLKELIKFIRKNIGIFETDKFQSRLKDNPYVENLSKCERKPTQERLENDEKLVIAKDPLVNKLIKARGNIIAHRNKDLALGKKKYIDILTLEEFYELIDRGMKICNYYSDLYNASTLAVNSLIGKDDYKTVLKYLEIAMTTLDFVNIKATKINDENYQIILGKFIEEVSRENYKNLFC